MTPNPVDAISIAAALRDGVTLQTVEVVALLHNACKQLDAGTAAGLHHSIEDIWVTDAGNVVLPRIARAESSRLAVAELLDQLLPHCTAVPAALRTLPARLRESGETRGSELKDLLTILRWHLPADSTEVLRDLVLRTRLTGPEFEDTSAIASFAIEDTTPAVSERRRSPRRLLIAATVLLAAGAAGYGSYRMRGDRGTPLVPNAPVAAPVAAAPVVAATTPAVATPHFLDLPVSGGAFSPSFAADRSLVFHAGHNTTGRLFRVSLDDRDHTSQLTPLIESGGRSYHPRPSPDGHWLAFDSDRDGERGIYLASRRDGLVTRVSGAGFATAPSWSPDTRWLAFVRAEASRPGVWNLWLRDVNSGAVTRATDFRSGQVWAASWFPDARSLCYSHEDRLYIATPGSASAKTFVSPIKGRLIRTPAVSPDGNRIVFQVFHDGAWMLDVNSGAMRRILADPTAEEFAWSPEGNEIAYHSKRDGQWRIWMLRI